MRLLANLLNIQIVEVYDLHDDSSSLPNEGNLPMDISQKINKIIIPKSHTISINHKYSKTFGNVIIRKGRDLKGASSTWNINYHHAIDTDRSFVAS